MKKEHLGGDFDSFLEAEGVLDEVIAKAVKCVVGWQIEQGLAESKKLLSPNGKHSNFLWRHNPELKKK